MRSFAALLLAAILAVLAAFSGAARAQTAVQTEKVTAELVSSRQTVAPGETFHIALRMQIVPDWHTYWRNPGDSGAATAIVFAPPQGWQVGGIVWPLPKPYRVEPLMTFVFEGETLYPIPVTVPSNAQPGTITLQAEAEWAVCSDICLFEGGTFALPVTVAAAGMDDPDWAEPIAKAVADAPKRGDLQARLTPEGDVVRLTATGQALTAAPIRDVYFFPYDGIAVDHAAPQRPETGPEGASVVLTGGTSGTLGQQPLSGVLAFDVEENGAWVRRGIELEASPGAALAGAAGRPASAAEGTGAVGTAQAGLGALPLMLALAFLGGLILNVMPCVFPVLSLKALSLARAGEGHAARHGVFFTVGVLATFTVLAGALIGLQAAGQSVGWGFQLQDPFVIGAMALLFFVIGLNLLGLFEVGGAMQGVGGSLAARQGDVGAFFTGALAVLAATPCTAPFMATAMGFAAVQPPLVSLSVFLALGLGFAAPMAALSFAPGLQRLLPKPGPWMDTLKQFFAFPMFATAVWLAWILSAQAGPPGVLVLLSVAAGLAFVIWAWRSLQGPVWRAAAAAVAALLVGAVGYVVRPEATALVAEPWTPARVAELQAQGRPVFVNFTADWCVTCKVNERTSLASDDVARAFAANGVTYLKGDWTSRDAEIAAELAAHGRNGVPLYLYYAPGAKTPSVLPQILTPGLVIDAVSGGAPAVVASSDAGSAGGP